MSFFHNAVAGAHRSVRRVAGVQITYQRGADYTTLQATPGKRDMAATTQQGVAVNYIGKTFVVSSCELVLNGNAITPSKEDVIKEAVGGKVYRYEVRRQDNGSQLYEDAGGGNYRIHCVLKEIVDG